MNINILDFFDYDEMQKHVVETKEIAPYSLPILLGIAHFARLCATYDDGFIPKDIMTSKTPDKNFCEEKILEFRNHIADYLAHADLTQKGVQGKGISLTIWLLTMLGVIDKEYKVLAKDVWQFLSQGFFEQDITVPEVWQKSWAHKIQNMFPLEALANIEEEIISIPAFLRD